jgi:hypothetical protein
MNHDPQLEMDLSEELRKLPRLRAPETLLPRVLAALERRAARPWWQRPWLAWPRALQAASVASGLVVMALAVWAEPLAWAKAGQSLSLQPVAAKFSAIASSWEAATALFSTTGHLLRAFQWFWVLALATVSALYLACVGLGTICFRVATDKV